MMTEKEIEIMRQNTKAIGDLVKNHLQSLERDEVAFYFISEEFVEDYYNCYDTQELFETAMDKIVNYINTSMEKFINGVADAVSELWETEYDGNIYNCNHVYISYSEEDDETFLMFSSYNGDFIGLDSKFIIDSEFGSRIIEIMHKVLDYHYEYDLEEKPIRRDFIDNIYGECYREY